MKINYYATEKESLPPFRRRILRQWLDEVVEKQGKNLVSINYFFMSDEELLRMNQQFLSHDFYTDILTFDASPEDPDSIEGDIAISLDRVRENARKLLLPYEAELHRVMIHGILHLCGLEDETPREALAMRIAEDHALFLLHKFLEGRPPLR